MKNIVLFITIFALTLLLSCEEYAEPETFLIPENYTGAVVVVFNQKMELLKNITRTAYLSYSKKRSTIYTIFSCRWALGRKVYYADEKDKKSSELTRIDFEKNPKKDANYILDQYDGGFSVFPEGGIKEGNSSDYPSVNWVYFTIGKVTSSKDSLRRVANNKIEKIKKKYSVLKK